MRAGHTAAYVDLDQIGFRGPAPADDPGGHRLKARNLAAIWHTYRAAGAECLIVVGPVENETALTAYADVLPAATVTLCRLHAGRDQLTRRIMLRGQGGGWSQPGDPLEGRSTEHLLQIADRAAVDAAALERAAIGDLCVDTDASAVEEAAAEVIARAGWTRWAG
jgi:chloramphenicol 3-O-phosphotransferase